jgi:dihydrofolate reductase
MTEMTLDPIEPQPDDFGAEIVEDGAAMSMADAGAEPEVFDLFMDRATRIELTEVHEDTGGDVCMAYPGDEWVEVLREERAADGTWPAHSFVTLVRK